METRKNNMKIVEKASPVVGALDEEQESLSESEKEDVFTMLLMGKDVTSEIETTRGTFVVKFPKQKDNIAIGRLMALNRGGLPAGSFDVENENRNLICSTLNVVVTSAPAWFENAKKNIKNFSFEEVPDEEFLLELYQKARSFREEVQKSFDKGNGAGPARISTAESVASNVEHGVFDGVEGNTIN